MTLRLDWCTPKAARYAVEHWHYSKTMPVAKRVSIGVWEHGQFIGAVIFSWGANPNVPKYFGVKMTECAELVRVALRAHDAPVSRIITIAVKMLRKQSPGLRVLVSYADTMHGHHGGIYQACGWIYLGATSSDWDYMHHGRILKRRSYTGRNFGQPRMKLPPGAVKVPTPPKHRYALPLDEAMAAALRAKAKPYPKRATAPANA